MKHTVVILFILSIVIRSYSQGTLLYNEFGQLRCDSSFQIDVGLLNVISEIESGLYDIYEAVQYPNEAYENRIGGLVIAKVHVNNEELSVWGEIVKKLDPKIDYAVYRAISDSPLAILRKTKDLENFEFYLPFRFEATTIPIMQDIEKHGVIRIRRHSLEPPMKNL